MDFFQHLHPHGPEVLDFQLLTLLPHIIKPVWVEFLIPATERIQAEESWLSSGTGVRSVDPPTAVSRGYGIAQA